MIPVCDWSEPGANRYTGEVIEAIHKMPLSQEALKEIIIKVKRKDFDDLVEITKNDITGLRGKYDPEISFMNFGTGQVCRRITRNKWKGFHIEHGMTYCSGATCVLIPAVCGNVSLITRTGLVAGERLSTPIPVPESEIREALKSPFSSENDAPVEQRGLLSKGGKRVNVVSEPSTLWLLVFALMLPLVTLFKKRK